MAAQVGAALGEDGVQRTRGVEVERHEHRGVLGAGDGELDGLGGVEQDAAQRGRHLGARASDQLHPLGERDLALERAVDRALGGDHLQALDLLVGEVGGHLHDEPKRVGQPRSAGLYSQSTVSPATSQPLRLAYISIVIAVHDGERGGEQLLRARAAVVAAVVLRLVRRERVRADLDVVAEVLELVGGGAQIGSL